MMLEKEGAELYIDRGVAVSSVFLVNAAVLELDEEVLKARGVVLGLAADREAARPEVVLADRSIILNVTCRLKRGKIGYQPQKEPIEVENGGGVKRVNYIKKKFV